MSNTRYRLKKNNQRKYKNSDEYAKNYKTLLVLPRILSGLIFIVFSIGGVFFLLNFYTSSKPAPTAQDLVSKNNLINQIPSEFATEKVLGVKSTEEVFDLSKKYQTRNLQNFTYFLSSECGKLAENCSVGCISKLDNEQFIFSQNLLKDLFNETLKDGQAIKFSKKQDFPDGVNIIWIINQFEYKLIRFSHKDKVVAQIFHIKADDEVFQNYL